MGGQFLNVDLEVRSKTDLIPLREAFGELVIEMFCGEVEPGRYLLSVELASMHIAHSAGADATAAALCDLVENLNEPGCRAWKVADDRVFDVGFDAVVDSQVGQALFSSRTLARIANLDARVALSLYTTHLAGDKKGK